MYTRENADVHIRTGNNAGSRIFRKMCKKFDRLDNIRTPPPPPPPLLRILERLSRLRIPTRAFPRAGPVVRTYTKIHPQDNIFDPNRTKLRDSLLVLRTVEFIPADVRVLLFYDGGGCKEQKNNTPPPTGVVNARLMDATPLARKTTVYFHRYDVLIAIFFFLRFLPAAAVFFLSFLFLVTTVGPRKYRLRKYDAVHSFERLKHDRD